MKKKIFTLFLALAASVGTMFAESGTCGENLTWNLTNSVLTISGTGPMTDYKSNQDVPWYSYRSSIKTVIIGNSVTSIGNYAFRGCTGLNSITIPNRVTSIEVATFLDCTGLTSIDIPNSVTSIGAMAFAGCTGLTSVAIPNSVTDIGEEAFYLVNNIVYSGSAAGSPWCAKSINGYVDGYLVYRDNTKKELLGCSSAVTGEIIIPNSVTSIGAKAFAKCTGLTSVSCLAAAPPQMGIDEYKRGVFYDLDCSKIPLYVPANSIDAYKVAEQWKDFGSIEPISAKDTETTTVKAEPTTNSVEVTWSVVAGAYTYEIVIKDKSGNVVCTLVFNAQGQLISIAFNAPGRDGAPQHKQEAGFSFVVNGLDSGTEYGFDVIAKDENGNVLDTKSGSFTTQAPQGIDDINAATESQKIVRDGQIFILRGEKTYTVTGQEVK